MLDLIDETLKASARLSRNPRPPPLVCAVDLGNSPSALVTQFDSVIYFIPFPSEELQECGCPTSPLLKWLSRLGAVRLFLQLRSFASVLDVNDEPCTGFVGCVFQAKGRWSVALSALWLQGRFGALHHISM